MRKASKLYVSVVACLMSTSALSSETENVDAVVNVGSDSGYSNLAAGKKIAAIHQGNCNYSMELLEDQYVKFNTPDVVFLESKVAPNEKSWPYLSQAEMSAGYDWSFRKDGDLKSKWFGLMCDSAENFDLHGSNVKNDAENISPELQQIKEANELKCPATLTAKGWMPNKSAGQPNEYTFQELKGDNWTGFIFGYKNRGNDSFGRISFCLVQGDNVLVGAAENYPKPLLLSPKTFEETKAVLSSVKFLQ